jgi:recombination protein RecT
MDAQITLSQKRSTFGKMLEKQGGELARVIPKHMRADRLLRIAQTAALKQPLLYDCDMASIGLCLQQCSERGLEPDGYYAHLIPFRDNRSGKMICTLIWDYKGLVELACRSGKVSHITAHVVYEDEAQDPDRFYIEYGSNERIVHKPDILAALRGQRRVVAVYAAATMTNGNTQFDLMTYDEVEAIARRSKTYNKKENKWFGPWDTDWNEMMKKTIIKRLGKLLPLSAEFREAVNDDNELEFDSPDLPEIDRMKPAEAVVEEVFDDRKGDPFKEANETTKTTTTLQPEAVKASPTRTESEPPEEQEQSEKLAQRLRRNKTELLIYNELLVAFKETDRDPKNLFEFGLDIPLDKCFIKELEMIKSALADERDEGEEEWEEEEDDGPTVDDVLGPVIEPDPAVKEEEPVARKATPSVDAEKILAVSQIRERIDSFASFGTPIHEDDIVRYAVSEHEQPKTAKKLEDLSKETVLSIGFFFTKVYEWVQENPDIPF